MSLLLIVLQSIAGAAALFIGKDTLHGGSTHCLAFACSSTGTACRSHTGDIVRIRNGTVLHRATAMESRSACWCWSCSVLCMVIVTVIGIGIGIGATGVVIR